MDNEKNNEVLNIDQQNKVQWYERQFSLDDYRMFIKANITTAARSFIAIGFYLKCVRDRELFLGDGYQSVWEFAKAEYGISMSTASRYMTMNDRFSEGGNSPNVKAEYRAFGKSQLQEMLSLSDEQMEQVKLTDRVEDIRGVRKPKEIPYIELPGQMELEKDFTDIFPEEEFEIPPLPSAQKQEFSMDIEELVEDVPECAALPQHIEESIAISQQEELAPNETEANTDNENAIGSGFAEIVDEYETWSPKRRKVMTRITEYSGGVPVIPHDHIKDAAAALAAYEETGLTPEEIMDGKLLTGWIPVEERLPEEPDSGMIELEYLTEYIVMIFGAEEATALYYAGDGEWYRDGEFYEVVAWMPLPEPYQG